MADGPDLSGLPEVNDLDSAYGDITPGGKLYGPGLTPGQREQIDLAADDSGYWVDAEGQRTDYAGAEPPRADKAKDVPPVGIDYASLIEKATGGAAKIVEKATADTAGVPAGGGAVREGAVRGYNDALRGLRPMPGAPLPGGPGASPPAASGGGTGVAVAVGLGVVAVGGLALLLLTQQPRGRRG